MSLTCKICNELVKDKKHFWRAHKLAMADYFIKYYNKRDLLTNELIDFKNVDQYLNTDFKTKNNLKAWLRSQPLEEAKKYCEEKFLQRRAEKGLIYSMSQVELRSLNSFLGIKNYIELFGDYYTWMEQLGFKNKFKSIKQELKENEKLKQFKIICDTREQLLLKLPNYKIGTLNFGDYCLEEPELNGNIFIERKSIQDFVGTLNSGFDRFKREIERAYLANAYLIVVVESSFSDICSFSYLPHVFSKTKITEEFILHRLRELMQFYSNFQLVAVKGRKEASRVIEKILYSDGVYKGIDCQYYYDLGLI